MGHVHQRVKRTAGSGMKAISFGMLLAVSLSSGALASAGPSFPCDKAQSRVEKAICADAELSGLDEHLGRYYAGGRQALADAAECFTANQRQWLRTVRDACADPACLKAAYLARLSELDGLQPGAIAIKQFPLPHGPTLAWIIPAALDQVAAPPYLLVLLMFMTGDTATRLTVLAKDPQATYLARGHATTNPRGQTYFEPSRCVFIYQLP